MGDVVPIGGKPEDKPHKTGPMRCRGCGHQWVSVRPVEMIDPLECPACKALKGWAETFIWPERRWECNCGCDLFTIGMIGTYCANCGLYQNFDWKDKA